MIQIESCSSDLHLALGIFRKAPICHLESQLGLNEDLRGSTYRLSRNPICSAIGFWTNTITFLVKTHRGPLKWSTLLFLDLLRHQEQNVITFFHFHDRIFVFFSFSLILWVHQSLIHLCDHIFGEMHPHSQFGSNFSIRATFSHSSASFFSSNSILAPMLYQMHPQSFISSLCFNFP